MKGILDATENGAMESGVRVSVVTDSDRLRDLLVCAVLLVARVVGDYAALVIVFPGTPDGPQVLLGRKGTVLGGISVALGALGVIRPGPAPSIVAMIISLPVLSYGILHL